MISIKLDLPYRMSVADAAQMAPRAVSALLIREVVIRTFGDRMPKEQARMFAAIQDALLEDADTLELTLPQLKFLVRTFEKVQLPATLSSWRFTLEDALVLLLAAAEAEKA